MKHGSCGLTILVIVGVLILSAPCIYAETSEEYHNRLRQENLQVISDCTKSIEINPNDAEAYKNRGFAYAMQDDINQTISDFTKAIEINPNYEEAYYNRGLVYYALDNFAQAISDFTKAIEINPEQEKNYFERGEAYYMMKEYDKAWIDVHKVEELGGAFYHVFIENLKKASGREK